MSSEPQLKWSDRLLLLLGLDLLPRWLFPNHLTILRFAMTPFVLYLIYYQFWTAGLVLFIAAVLTDSLDGALARSRDQITEWGKIYDPVADKLLIGLTAILILPRLFGFFLVFLILISEIIIIISAYRAKYHKKQQDIQANNWGKAKMFTQSLALTVLIVSWIIPFPDTVLLGVEAALYCSVGLALMSAAYTGL